MPALLFGSISTIADTSELQRAAFNDAFDEHDLDWNWDVDEYRGLLTSNGGADRVADYAHRRGADVDAAAVHATKSHRFQDALVADAPPPRPGVLDTIAAAREAGWRVGLVTTTSAANLDALFAGLGDQLTRDDFDVIVDREDVESPKPDAEAYRFALTTLGAEPGDCVAVEDNVGGLASAESAGVTCVVFANENTSGHDFGDAPRTELLDFGSLRAFAGAE